MRTPSYHSALAAVLKQHPGIDSDEARDMAHDWAEEAARDAMDREDTYCIEDHAPAEYFTEREQPRRSGRYEAACMALYNVRPECSECEENFTEHGERNTQWCCQVCGDTITEAVNEVLA